MGLKRTDLCSCSDTGQEWENYEETIGIRHNDDDDEFKDEIVADCDISLKHSLTYKQLQQIIDFNFIINFSLIII